MCEVDSKSSLDVFDCIEYLDYKVCGPCTSSHSSRNMTFCKRDAFPFSGGGHLSQSDIVIHRHLFRGHVIFSDFNRKLIWSAGFSRKKSSRIQFHKKPSSASLGTTKLPVTFPKCFSKTKEI